jgi:flagellar hook-length control protein FliK
MTASVLNTLSPVATVSDALGGVNSAPKIAAGEEFSASFLQQIKGLQAQASEAAQPSSVLEKIADSIKGQGGQDFSALLGDSLPQIKQQIQAQDINLDETMTALKEVLAQLDSLSTDNTLPTDTLQDLAAKLEPSTITDTKVVAQGIKNSGDLASKLSSPLTQTNDPSVSAPLSETKVVVNNNQGDLIDDNTLDLVSKLSSPLTQTNDPSVSAPLSETKAVVNNNQGDLIDDNTLDLAFNLSSSLTQTNEPTVLKNYEPRSSSGIEEAHEQVVQGDIVDVQPETINIIMQQAQLMSETDDQTIAQNVQVTTQLLKQEKSYAQTQLSGEQSTKSKQPEINLNQLLTREKIINNDTDFAPLVSAKGAEKIVDSALLSTSQPVSEQANKFSTTDLIALNRQVESSVTKQELPPMTKSFNQPEWKQEFNERIIWMHKKSIPSAQLRLNPQSLGPISIQINIDKDQQANIVFNAQNAGVREAIEASIPKLREMLNMQQINLAEVNVSQQQQQGQGSARQAMQDAMAENNRNNTGNSMDSTEIEPEVNDIAEEINQGRALSSKGLLSIYA